ncbi:hypothetical protein GM51_4810 [freshwater metagenome]|uniref:Glycosyltransferase 2-like domain-containing protein n=1 Tax=freshwater metagenome TaxID=449393 RepID=A0A094QBY6_9ZZZZ
MLREAKVVVGLPVYRITEYSMNRIIQNLNQNYPNIFFVISIEREDDNKIKNEFFEKLTQNKLWIEGRISVSFNLKRIGLIANWNLVKRISFQDHPDLSYFCWFSDHDEFGEKFVEEGVEIMNSNLEYVSCFPNYELGERLLRLKLVKGRNMRRGFAKSFSPGVTIYGLHRGETVRDLFLRHTFLPDRIFMFELELRGAIIEYFTNAKNYKRIILKNSKFSLDRQRSNLFGKEQVPTIKWQNQHYEWLLKELNSTKIRVQDKDYAELYIRQETLMKNINFYQRIKFKDTKIFYRSLMEYLYGRSQFEVLWSDSSDVNAMLKNKLNILNIRSFEHLPYLGDITKKFQNSVVILEKNRENLNDFEITFIKKMQIKMLIINKSSYGLIGILNRLLSELLSIIFLLKVKNQNWPYVKRNFTRSSLVVKFIAIIIFIPCLIPFIKNLSIKIVRNIISLTWPKEHVIFDNIEIDSVIVTPGNMRDTKEIMSIVFAKRKRINNAIVILSWDNTNSKGTFTCLPDIFFCWNKYQRRDLIDLHKVTEDKINISGPLYLEKWTHFDERILPLKNEVVNRNYILFLGSSLNIFSDEIKVIKQIKKMLLLSNPNRRLQLYYRPHPASLVYAESIKEELDALGVFQSEFSYSLISNLVPSREYHELILNAKIITGLNTSAFIDCVLLGRKVFPLIFPGALQYSVSHFSSAVENRIFCPVNLDFFKDANIQDFNDQITEKDDLEAYLPNIGFASKMIYTSFRQRGKDDF